MVLVQLRRGGSSDFGLVLSTFNRVAHVEEGSAAQLAGVLSLDRVTHVDGIQLRDRAMAELVEGNEMVELTIERPPRGLQGAILAKEDAPNATSPLMMRAPGLVARLFVECDLNQ